MNDPVHWDGHERQVRRILHPGDGSWYGGHAWRISIRPGQATVAPSATCGCTRGRGQVTCGWRIRSMTKLACDVQSCAGLRSWYRSPIRELLVLAIHLLVIFAKLLRPGGVRAVAAESLMLRHQLLINNRSPQRAPNLTSIDRFVLGLSTLFVSPRRIPKLGALVKPATPFKFHKALVDRKYGLLFSSSSHRRKPGPKGPSAELIAAIVEIKLRNPKFGCVRIAQQLSQAFGIEIDKDVVRRVLAKHYRPGGSGTNGPSWLTLIGHLKDSLWSIDFFHCESILLRSHWVLVVMDCSAAGLSASASNALILTASLYVGCSIG
jgi:hypothetical protein